MRSNGLNRPLNYEQPAVEPVAALNFEQPDAAAVESDKAAAFGLVCANCGSSEAAPGVKLQRCTGCKDVVYCDKRCARRNWKRHKPDCKAKAPK